MRRRDDRGAVSLFVGVMSLVLVVASAFTVDIGMQRVARRDMQSLADVVALDLSRELNGRTVATLGPLMPGLAAEAQARNGDTLGDTPALQVELGSVSGSGTFSVMAAGVPTAVRVTASTNVDFAFGVASSGAATRSAVSMAQSGSCLRLGSYVASINSAQSALLNPLLGGLLGTTLNISAVGYTGLATADVTLAELVSVGGLGVGTVDELLALDNVSVGDFFLASARVLDSQGKGAEADLLRVLAASATTPTLAIADLIEAAPGDQSALNAQFNVLSLVQGAAMVANQGNAVSLPGLSANIGIGTTTASLTVIEAPRVRCGPVGTEFDTAQVRLDLTTRINGQTIAVPALGTNVTVDPFDVAVSFDLGKAIATLSGVTCSASGVDSLAVALRSSVVGSLSVAASARVRASITVPLLGGSGILGSLLTTILSTLGLGSLLFPPELIVDNTLSLTGGAAGTTFTKNLTLPIPGSYTVPVGSGSGAVIGAVSLTPLVSSNLTLRYRTILGALRERTILSTDSLFSQTLSPVTSTVLSSIVNPLISSLQTTVITPLTELLGVQLGGADVWAVPTASCSSPRLVG